MMNTTTFTILTSRKLCTPDFESDEDGDERMDEDPYDISERSIVLGQYTLASSNEVLEYYYVAYFKKYTYMDDTDPTNTEHTRILVKVCQNTVKTTPIKSVAYQEEIGQFELNSMHYSDLIAIPSQNILQTVGFALVHVEADDDSEDDECTDTCTAIYRVLFVNYEKKNDWELNTFFYCGRIKSRISASLDSAIFKANRDWMIVQLGATCIFHKLSWVGGLQTSNVILDNLGDYVVHHIFWNWTTKESWVLLKNRNESKPSKMKRMGKEECANVSLGMDYDVKDVVKQYIITHLTWCIVIEEIYYDPVRFRVIEVHTYHVSHTIFDAHNKQPIQLMPLVTREDMDLNNKKLSISRTELACKVENEIQYMADMMDRLDTKCFLPKDRLIIAVIRVICNDSTTGLCFCVIGSSPKTVDCFIYNGYNAFFAERVPIHKIYSEGKIDLQKYICTMYSVGNSGGKSICVSCESFDRKMTNRNCNACILLCNPEKEMKILF